MRKLILGLIMYFNHRYYGNIIITPLYNYYNGIGILLKKGLILPIRNPKAESPHRNSGFFYSSNLPDGGISNDPTFLWRSNIWHFLFETKGVIQ